MVIGCVSQSGVGLALDRHGNKCRIVEQGGSSAEARDLDTILTSYICIAALSILILAQ